MVYFNVTYPAEAAGPRPACWRTGSGLYGGRGGGGRDGRVSGSLVEPWLGQPHLGGAPFQHGGRSATFTWTKTKSQSRMKSHFGKESQTFFCRNLKHAYVLFAHELTTLHSWLVESLGAAKKLNKGNSIK